MSKAIWAVLVVTIALGTPVFSQERAPRTPTPGPARLEQLVEANIVAVHAYQMLLARKQHSVDPRLLACKRPEGC